MKNIYLTAERPFYQRAASQLVLECSNVNVDLKSRSDNLIFCNVRKISQNVDCLRAGLAGLCLLVQCVFEYGTRGPVVKLSAKKIYPPYIPVPFKSLFYPPGSCGNVQNVKNWRFLKTLNFRPLFGHRWPRIERIFTIMLPRGSTLSK